MPPKHKPTRTGSVTRPTAGGGNSVALSLSPAGGGGAGGPSPAPESTVKGGGRNAGTSVRGTPPPSPAPPAAPSTARGVKEGVVVQAVRPASRAPPSPFPFPPVHPDWWKPRVGTFLEHLLHTRRADAEVVLTLLSPPPGSPPSRTPLPAPLRALAADGPAAHARALALLHADLSASLQPLRDLVCVIASHGGVGLAPGLADKVDIFNTGVKAGAHRTDGPVFPAKLVRQLLAASVVSASDLSPRALRPWAWPSAVSAGRSKEDGYVLLPSDRLPGVPATFDGSDTPTWLCPSPQPVPGPRGLQTPQHALDHPLDEVTFVPRITTTDRVARLAGQVTTAALAGEGAPSSPVFARLLHLLATGREAGPEGGQHTSTAQPGVVNPAIHSASSTVDAAALHGVPIQHLVLQDGGGLAVLGCTPMDLCGCAACGGASDPVSPQHSSLARALQVDYGHKARASQHQRLSPDSHAAVGAVVPCASSFRDAALQVLLARTPIFGTLGTNVELGPLLLDAYRRQRAQAEEPGAVCVTPAHLCDSVPPCAGTLLTIEPALRPTRDCEEREPGAAASADAARAVEEAGMAALVDWTKHRMDDESRVRVGIAHDPVVVSVPLTPCYVGVDPEATAGKTHALHVQALLGLRGKDRPAPCTILAEVFLHTVLGPGDRLLSLLSALHVDLTGLTPHEASALRLRKYGTLVQARALGGAHGEGQSIAAKLLLDRAAAMLCVATLVDAHGEARTHVGCPRHGCDPAAQSEQALPSRSAPVWRCDELLLTALSGPVSEVARGTCGQERRLLRFAALVEAFSHEAVDEVLHLSSIFGSLDTCSTFRVGQPPGAVQEAVRSSSARDEARTGAVLRADTVPLTALGTADALSLDLADLYSLVSTCIPDLSRVVVGLHITAAAADDQDGPPPPVPFRPNLEMETGVARGLTLLTDKAAPSVVADLRAAQSVPGRSERDEATAVWKFSQRLRGLLGQPHLLGNALQCGLASLSASWVLARKERDRAPDVDAARRVTLAHAAAVARDVAALAEFGRGAFTLALTAWTTEHAPAQQQWMGRAEGRQRLTSGVAVRAKSRPAAGLAPHVPPSAAVQLVDAIERSWQAALVVYERAHVQGPGMGPPGDMRTSLEHAISLLREVPVPLDDLAALLRHAPSKVELRAARAEDMFDRAAAFARKVQTLMSADTPLTPPHATSVHGARVHAAVRPGGTADSAAHLEDPAGREERSAATPSPSTLKHKYGKVGLAHAARTAEVLGGSPLLPLTTPARGAGQAAVNAILGEQRGGIDTGAGTGTALSSSRSDPSSLSIDPTAAYIFSQLGITADDLDQTVRADTAGEEGGSMTRTRGGAVEELPFAGLPSLDPFSPANFMAGVLGVPFGPDALVSAMPRPVPRRWHDIFTSVLCHIVDASPGADAPVISAEVVAAFRRLPFLSRLALSETPSATSSSTVTISAALELLAGGLLQRLEGEPRSHDTALTAEAADAGDLKRVLRQVPRIVSTTAADIRLSWSAHVWEQRVEFTVSTAIKLLLHEVDVLRAYCDAVTGDAPLTRAAAVGAECMRAALTDMVRTEPVEASAPTLPHSVRLIADTGRVDVVVFGASASELASSASHDLADAVDARGTAADGTEVESDDESGQSDVTVNVREAMARTLAASVASTQAVPRPRPGVGEAGQGDAFAPLIRGPHTPILRRLVGHDKVHGAAGRPVPACAPESGAPRASSDGQSVGSASDGDLTSTSYNSLEAQLQPATTAAALLGATRSVGSSESSVSLIISRRGVSRDTGTAGRGRGPSLDRQADSSLRDQGGSSRGKVSGSDDPTPSPRGSSQSDLDDEFDEDGTDEVGEEYVESAPAVEAERSAAAATRIASAILWIGTIDVTRLVKPAVPPAGLSARTPWVAPACVVGGGHDSVPLWPACMHASYPRELLESVRWAVVLSDGLQVPPSARRPPSQA